jgi:hypothetical protein
MAKAQAIQFWWREVGMQAVGAGIWIHECAFMGLRHGLRTTFVRMRDGRLWVHSPTALDESLARAVARLGEVGCLVAANNHHHRWLLDWHAAYPHAEVFVSRAVPSKRPALRAYRVIEHTTAPPWSDVLAQAFMAGVPFFDETVFLHQKSGSLIVTDFVQNHRDPEPIGCAARMAVPLFARLGFSNVCLAPPLRLRWLRRDPDAFQGFLAQVAAWRVERIVVTHGRVVEEDAPQHLRRVLQQAGA